MDSISCSLTGNYASLVGSKLQLVKILNDILNDIKKDTKTFQKLDSPSSGVGARLE